MQFWNRQQCKKDRALKISVFITFPLSYSSPGFTIQNWRVFPYYANYNLFSYEHYYYYWYLLNVCNLSHLFHKYSKPNREHPMLRNPNLLLPHSRNEKKTTPIRKPPLRAMTFLRWSNQPRSSEPSWWQEGTTLFFATSPATNVVNFSKCKLYDMIAFGFCFVPNNFRNWSNVNLWALACIWFGFHCMYTITTMRNGFITF